MGKIVHVAIGSTASKPADLDGNLRQIQAFARRAAADGAQILLTPEMSASGYGPYDDVLATAEPAGKGPIFDALAGTAEQTGVVVCAGFCELAEDGKRYISHYVVYPDGRWVLQPKHRISKAEAPLEPKRWPDEPGKRKERFNYFYVGGVKCALAICADSACLEPVDIFAEDGVELMLHPSGAGGKRPDRVTDAELATEAGRANYLRVLEQVFFPKDAVEKCLRNRRALMACNMVCHDGRDFYHLGHGFIVTPAGEVPGFYHGQPNLDRQRPMYAHAEIDVLDVPGA